MLRRILGGRVWAATLVLLLFGCVAKADRVDDYIRTQMQKKGIPGISVAVIQRGKVLKFKAYGYADIENSVPMTTRAVYPIASITKTFTATAVMMLVEEGKLRLD